MAVILLVTTAMTTKARADLGGAPPQPEQIEECHNVIRQCDKAVTQYQNLSIVLADELQKTQDQNKVLDKQRRELLEANGKWYKDPLTMVLLGVILGVGIAR